ncbi:capping protein, Arp2/3 and myosin-I linker protein 3-like [Aquila chrysaetos chrysaetos]|uniref:capping protein, Arp2/3 and myosin-I linker protein 3-like n=1 Tax=Aquila chrysaetos chrysaetos TaxID=223781 RepID=UPI001B7D2B54|nr:capping protein, Arp2/3 and myosin-I linker protein 3-like [Aquila chrysaetos chrysaetos]
MGQSLPPRRPLSPPPLWHPAALGRVVAGDGPVCHLLESVAGDTAKAVDKELQLGEVTLAVVTFLTNVVVEELLQELHCIHCTLAQHMDGTPEESGVVPPTTGRTPQKH